MKMQQMTQTLTRWTIALCALFFLMPLAHSQTPPVPTPVPTPYLVITDAGEPHAAIIRFDSFSTSLSAKVHNAPQTTTEATITGPTWKWEGGTAAVHLTSLSGSSNSGLDSGTIPNYGSVTTIAATPLHEVPVQCTATYTRTQGKDVTTIPVTGSKIVKFFIRIPEIVFGVTPRQNDLWNGILVRRPENNQHAYLYGHRAYYNLQIKDNQDKNPDAGFQRQPYGNGLPHEEFAGDALNGPMGGSTWGLDLASGIGSGTANFTDVLGGGYLRDSRFTDYAWAYEANGASVQNWQCLEFKPPFNRPYIFVQPGRFGPDGTEQPKRNPQSGDFLPDVEESELGAHNVDRRWGFTVRTGSGYPYQDSAQPVDDLPESTN